MESDNIYSILKDKFDFNDPESWFSSAKVRYQVRKILYQHANELDNQMHYRQVMKIWSHIGNSGILSNPGDIKSNVSEETWEMIRDLFISIAQSSSDVSKWIDKNRCYLKFDYPFST